jgi:hypothetical protein
MRAEGQDRSMNTMLLGLAEDQFKDEVDGSKP